MTIEQTTTLLKKLQTEYNNFKLTDEKIKLWHDTLQQYDNEEVNERLKELMQTQTYANVSPTLTMLTADLKKVNDKVDFTKLVYFCNRCRKAFNDRDLLEIHEDRCRSIAYIERQYERFNLGSINKRELYNMEQEEFDTRYDKLLKYVLAHSEDEKEKNRIELIFDPSKFKNISEVI